MSLQLLIDEDTQAQVLINKLRAAGHDVLTVNNVGLAGQPDAVILEKAVQLGRVLLTSNCGDFQRLHQSDPEHAGIVAIYRDSESRKNMNYDQIVAALARLENMGMNLEGEFWPLNQYR